MDETPMAPTYDSLEYYPIAVRVLPRVSATLSALGSSWIIYDVSFKKKLKRVNHRILLGMSIADIISSICTALGRLPAPSNVELYPGLGNTQTCSAQGFFYQTIVSTVAYNSALAVYYLLVVKYQWKEERIKQMEWYMHGYAILLFVISGCVLLGLELFNADYFICFIASIPSGCQINCERGIKPDLFRWIFFYGPVWIMIVAVTIIMIMVYDTVLRQERKMDKFIFRPSNKRQSQQQEHQRQHDEAENSNQEHHDHVEQQQQQQQQSAKTTTSTETATASSQAPRTSTNISTTQQQGGELKRRKYSRHVAMQGLWYLVPFYLAWLFPMLTHALASTDTNANYGILLNLVACFMPLQGFMNVIVYLRPQMLQWYHQKVKQRTESSCNKDSRYYRESNAVSGTTGV